MNRTAEAVRTEPTAAGGREREVSEWQLSQNASKFSERCVMR